MFFRSLSDRLRTIFRSRFSVVREINQKYAKPRIAMNRWQVAALSGLLCYLIFLILIFILKFITLIL